jgi:PTH1 family peptidyl-tRNA hydrolase
LLILAGLGNPGVEYAKTRHNLGAMAVRACADRWNFGAPRRRFASLAREGEIALPAGGSVRALILEPQTYYNESGRAVAEAMGFFRLSPGDVVVFHDEIDLAPGRVRAKTGGGAAGNNGVRSLIAQIGPDFRRVRLGVGHPGQKDAVMHHVLAPFAKSEAGWVADVLAACADALPFLAAGEDERFQAEVLRLAPAPKLDPRGRRDLEG